MTGMVLGTGNRAVNKKVYILGAAETQTMYVKYVVFCI